MRMKKHLLTLASGVLLAFIASVAGMPGAYEYYRFKTGNFPREQEISGIKNTIKLFSATVAGLYASGGIVAGLNTFPAEKLVKRRILQDIRMSKNEGKLYVMDRDKSKVNDIKLFSPDRAIAVVDEDWFGVYQNSVTRRQISGKKANLITVRYFLKKMWGKWVIVDYEIHARGEALPSVTAEVVLKW